MNSLFVCSGAERDSTVWLTATTSLTSATAQHENTPTQGRLSAQSIYLLNDVRLFYVNFRTENTTVNRDISATKLLKLAQKK